MDKNIIKRIKKAVGYNGRKVRILPFKPISLNSYWSEGSRDYFYFIDLNSFSVYQVPQNGTVFDKTDLRAEKLEPNEVLVKSSIFQGHQCTLNIYVQKESL